MGSPPGLNEILQALREDVLGPYSCRSDTSLSNELRAFLNSYGTRQRNVSMRRDEIPTNELDERRARRLGPDGAYLGPAPLPGGHMIEYQWTLQPHGVLESEVAEINPTPEEMVYQELPDDAWRRGNLEPQGPGRDAGA